MFLKSIYLIVVYFTLCQILYVAIKIAVVTLCCGRRIIHIHHNNTFILHQMHCGLKGDYRKLTGNIDSTFYSVIDL